MRTKNLWIVLAGLLVSSLLFGYLYLVNRQMDITALYSCVQSLNGKAMRLDDEVANGFQVSQTGDWQDLGDQEADRFWAELMRNGGGDCASIPSSLERKDLWGNSLRVSSRRSHKTGRVQFHISSNGPDGKENTDDDLRADFNLDVPREELPPSSY